MSSRLTDEQDAIKLEKNTMMELFRKNKNSNIFKPHDEDSDSFYVTYNDSRHMDSPLKLYNGDDIGWLRRQLEMLWGDDIAKECILPIIAAKQKLASRNEQNYVKEVDIFNYMA